MEQKGLGEEAAMLLRKLAMDQNKLNRRSRPGNRHLRQSAKKIAAGWRTECTRKEQIISIKLCKSSIVRKSFQINILRCRCAVARGWHRFISP